MIAALLPVEVEVEGRLYLVRRPVVREAMAIAEYAAYVADDDARATLREFVGQWLGPDLTKALFAQTPNELAMRLVDLIRWETGEEKEGGGEVDWAYLIAKYARFYRVSPEQVFDTSWPLFLSWAAQMDRLRAEEQITNAEWYAGAKTGSMDSVIRRAGGIRPTFEEPEIMKDPAWLERQREVIQRIRQKQARA